MRMAALLRLRPSGPATSSLCHWLLIAALAQVCAGGGRLQDCHVSAGWRSHQYRRLQVGSAAMQPLQEGLCCA